MEDIWILPIIIVLVFLVLAFTSLISIVDSTSRIIYRHFWCPIKRVAVRVAFITDPFNQNKYLDVKACSAFKDEEGITCEKECLNLPKVKQAPETQTK